MKTAEKIRQAACQLRPAESGDRRFLLQLYAEGRAAEPMLQGMDPVQREIFLEMQFRAREASYAMSYPGASDHILCWENGEAIGRVLVDRTRGRMLLVDLAVSRAQQGRGLGTQILETLQRECASAGWRLHLQVLKGSAAERLYRRLGFVSAGEDPLRRQMIWSRTSGGSAENTHCRPGLQGC